MQEILILKSHSPEKPEANHKSRQTVQPNLKH